MCAQNTLHVRENCVELQRTYIGAYANTCWQRFRGLPQSTVENAMKHCFRYLRTGSLLSFTKGAVMPGGPGWPAT